LIELLLATALLSTVMVLAVPTFYQTAAHHLEEGRFDRFKTHVMTVKTAIRLQIQDQARTSSATWILDPSATDGTVADPASRISRLIASGHLAPGAATVENVAGQVLALKVRDTGSDPLLPALNQDLLRLHVCVSSTDFDVDAALSGGADFETVWATVRSLAP